MSLRHWIVSSFVMAGCAEPAPPPATPPPATPSLVSPAAAPQDAGPQVVWTTESKKDECRAFPVESAPPFSTFDSREACEIWVRQRRCRPGSSCYDGCNTRSCSRDGDHVLTTLVSCELLAQANFEFQRGSSVAPASVKPKIKEIEPALQRILGDPTGTIALRGQATQADASTAAARTKLTEARTKVIRDLLVAAGIPSARVATATEPGDAPTSGIVLLVAHADGPRHECVERP